MNTQNKSKDSRRFIILVPHRDFVRLLKKYREELFALGFSGAYSFPAAAPLAEISAPLSRDELKELAHSLREISAENGGSIFNSGTAFVPFPDDKMSLLGLKLKLPLIDNIIPETAKRKIRRFFPPVLCAALVDPLKNQVPPEAPVLSFRAAYLANLAIRPLYLSNGDITRHGISSLYSYEWKTGLPVWLPAAKRK